MNVHRAITIMQFIAKMTYQVFYHSQKAHENFQFFFVKRNILKKLPGAKREKILQNGFGRSEKTPEKLHRAKREKFLKN